MQNQQAELDWRDGTVPVSTRFDDPYFSLQNGLEETRHVFLQGNDLPARFVSGFHIGELGFGTGLNLLAVWQSWLEAGMQTQLRFTSFEAFPMAVADMERAHLAFPDLADLAAQLRAAWTGGGRMKFDRLELEVITGDARITLPDWQGSADAWFLDGFSPAKNPELWQSGLMADIARHTNPGGSAATYTAAGFVRRGLAEAGFTVTRTPGFGRKRHMTRAVLM